MVDQKVRDIIVLVVLLTCVLTSTLNCAKAQEQESVTLYIVNPLTGNGSFNVNDYAVNSVFTVDFYIGTVTNLVAWQIRLTYNRTLIQYDAAWFPENNAFEMAAKSGATPLWEVLNNVNNASEVGDLAIIMTSSYPPDNSAQYPVNVTSKDPLCEVNFTIVSHGGDTQLDFVNAPLKGTVVSPEFMLSDYTTCVETTSGTYPAGGQPATIDDFAEVSEASAMLVLIMIPATSAFALARRRMKRYHP
ncbi:MAG: hypothetical protein ABSB89_03490 [Candidatus Bathyarchaeia archaeon]|jgi:hypothetical protein